MEREISSGAMLGIVLLALAAVIGLGFGVFAITKGVANEGTVNVQDSLGTVSTQVFLDYDQKIVTGQQVTSGLKQFEGKAYSVLIATKALQSGAKIVPNHTAHPIQATVPGYDKAIIFINYNALLAEEAGGGKWKTGTVMDKDGIAITAGKADIMKLENGAFINKTGFAADGGNVLFDKETSGIYKTGNAEYVSTSSKYQAYLIKDASGNIMGISAIQQ